ncbi:MAG: hypothetical protein ACREER_12290 [Alphaproteobacteria bacterium]
MNRRRALIGSVVGSGGLGALRAVRPSFDALYEVLAAAQRHRVDALLDHGHPA